MSTMLLTPAEESNKEQRRAWSRYGHSRDPSPATGARRGPRHRNGGRRDLCDRRRAGWVEGDRIRRRARRHCVAVPSSAWLANPDGTKVCEPVSGEGHDAHWHFKVEPLMPVKKSSFYLRVGEEEAVIDLARGAEPRNDGILSVLKVADAPEWRAFLELKLHGDAGDLELWLYQGFAVSNWSASGARPTPFDVPAETVVRLTFSSHDGKAIELRVRDKDKNEDEQGTPNMRDGRTNYFIFPGESGQDPEWLVGEKNRYNVAASRPTAAGACDPLCSCRTRRSERDTNGGR